MLASSPKTANIPESFYKVNETGCILHLNLNLNGENISSMTNCSNKQILSPGEFNEQFLFLN